MFILLMNLITPQHHHHHLNYVYGVQLNKSLDCPEVCRYNHLQLTKT